LIHKGGDILYAYYASSVVLAILSRHIINKALRKLLTMHSET
jgi:hypothetical protein